MRFVPGRNVRGFLFAVTHLNAGERLVPAECPRFEGRIAVGGARNLEHSKTSLTWRQDVCSYWSALRVIPSVRAFNPVFHSVLHTAGPGIPGWCPADFLLELQSCTQLGNRGFPVGARLVFLGNSSLAHSVGPGGFPVGARLVFLGNSSLPQGFLCSCQLA